MTNWYLQNLACPDCEEPLNQTKGEMVCAACGFSSPLTDCLDLRPKRRRSKRVECPITFDIEGLFGKVEKGRPRLTYEGPLGGRDSRELLSVIMQTVNNPGRVLDLGCGPRDQFEPITSLGHHYVGIDLNNCAADVQADAHVLPFRDATFDCVFSFAVLEHLHSPLVALNEIKRVLKPGGVFCGTVSQGEPFHSSFFHHTSWGLLSLAHASGFEVLRLWTCTDTLYSLASMGRYPRVLRAGIHALDSIHQRLPFLAPRKVRWSKEEKLVDALHRAGSIGFVVRKLAE